MICFFMWVLLQWSVALNFNSLWKSTPRLPHMSWCWNLPSWLIYSSMEMSCVLTSQCFHCHSDLSHRGRIIPGTFTHFPKCTWTNTDNYAIGTVQDVPTRTLTHLPLLCLVASVPCMVWSSQCREICNVVSSGLSSNVLSVPHWTHLRKNVCMDTLSTFWIPVVSTACIWSDPLPMKLWSPLLLD